MKCYTYEIIRDTEQGMAQCCANSRTEARKKLKNIPFLTRAKYHSEKNTEDHWHGVEVEYTGHKEYYGEAV